MDSVQTNAMTTGSYLVACPALGVREIVYGGDAANDACYDLHQESGSYAWCEDWLGHTFVEYGDINDGIADLVFN